MTESGLQVQSRACSTCVYRRALPINARLLEAAVADGYGGMNGYRVCHQSSVACCRGFWNRWKNKFALGQIAQRLGLVVMVQSHDKRGGRISAEVERAWRAGEGEPIDEPRSENGILAV